MDKAHKLSLTEHKFENTFTQGNWSLTSEYLYMFYCSSCNITQFET